MRLFKNNRKWNEFLKSFSDISAPYFLVIALISPFFLIFSLKIPLLAIALLPIVGVFTIATVYIALVDSRKPIKSENTKLMNEIKGNTKDNDKNK